MLFGLGPLSIICSRLVAGGLRWEMAEELGESEVGGSSVLA